MIVIYDHLVAVLVGGVILLLLFNVHQRVNQSSVERTMMYMAKTNTLALASYLERDLMTAGFNTPPIESGILAHGTTNGITDTLAFWGVGASGARTRIAYGVSFVDSAAINGEVKPLYQLRRYERQGGTFVQVGGSGPNLTQFDIQLLTEGNLEADFFTAARFKLRLAVAVFPNFESDAHLTGYRQLRWGVTLDPPGLQQ